MRIALLQIAVCAALAAGTARAQFVVNAARLSERSRNFDWRPDDQALNCSVAQIRPALNYGFRFQAGYVVRVPMNQYRGTGHRWTILMRVTPENGGPVYLMSRYGLPDVPKTSAEVEVGGGYLIGEGNYRVAWKLTDETGRVCRREWKVEARLRRSESKVRVAMPPRTVDSFSNWKVAPGAWTDDAPPIRLTVLMNATAVSPRRLRMTARDRILLLGTLSSLLERVPTLSTRVVVFNLDQQRELFREDNFSAESFNRVAQAINELELGLVDYHVLQNKGGEVDLLADLVRKEVNAAQPADVALFLGPLARQISRVPDEILERPSGSTPRFFYFQYRPALRMEATLPDIIHSAVSKLKGKTMIIHSPGEFAKAIDQVERAAPPRSGRGVSER